MKYVIIGNSAAGIAAIEAIQEKGPKGSITVISDEPHINYSRPLITYLLANKIKSENMGFREEDFYTRNNVKLIMDNKAVKLNLSGGNPGVVLAYGNEILFDRLLIATGGMPIIPEIIGVNLPGVFTFTKLADSFSIAEYIKKNNVKESVVIGGGLIGLKTTEALMELRVKVTIIELADRILSASFDREASLIIENALKNNDCGLIAENTVMKIEGEGRKILTLRNGRTISTDMVVVAVGVKPNVELVKDTQVKINKGILVDEYMQTSVNGIYSAGDCCEADDLLLGIKRPIAIWPNAIIQGRIAGYNMAGIKKRFNGGLAMNSVQLCGIPAVSIGQTCGTDNSCEILHSYNEDSQVYKKIILKNDIIIGALLIKEIEGTGIYSGLIKEKIVVTAFKQLLLEKDFGIISLPESFRKHLIAEGKFSTI